MAGAVIATVSGTTAVSATVVCTQQYSGCTSDEQCCAGSVCEYGLCMPGCRIDGTFLNALTSPADNTCAVCDPAVSTTSLVPANEGMSCWSGDPYAGVTTCQEGTCTSAAPASCPPPTPCHTNGRVDQSTGQCVYDFAEAGTPCGNGPMCYGGFYQPADTCDGAGFCIGGGSQTVSCFPYECGDSACLTSCVTSDDCQFGYSCRNSVCFQATCQNTVLSGGPDPTAGIGIDDDLTVNLNGIQMYDDPNNQPAGVRPPVALGATANGADTVQVIGMNSTSHCGFQSIGPLYLHCLDTGSVQVLDADGFDAGVGSCGNVFYNQTFTVAL